jgi:hypothetical protein
MLTLICAGGSGARILEALIHLCAAGLGPTKLRTFVIDPDAANGNLDVTKKLVERYVRCRTIFANDQFFRTELDLIQSENELCTWIPVNTQQKFESVLNYHQLTPAQQEIVRLLFTQDELDMEMNVGFRGHPSLGAAALSLLPIYQANPADAFWKKITTLIQHDVMESEARVVIAGSVFGGTGASAIHPLVRYLRSSMAEKENFQKLKVAAVALVPYFKFSSSDAAAGAKANQDEVVARSEHFALAAKSAANYYDHLQRTKDWDFDAMYWMGDDTPVNVKYCKGGSPQQNPAHFVELLGALACLDFGLSPPSQKSCCYSGPLDIEGLKDLNPVTWKDLPLGEGTREDAQRQLHAFHLAAVAHQGFFRHVFEDSRLETQSYCLPWYHDRFDGGSESLQSKESRDQLEALRIYFSQNYFPWWAQIHSLDNDRVRLFNPAVWRDGPDRLYTNRLDNLRYPDNHEHFYDCVDRLFAKTIEVAPKSSDQGSPPARYFSILTNAAVQLVEQEDRAKPGN